MLVYFRQIPQPKYRHFLAFEILWLEFGKLYEDKPQPFYHLVSMFHLHDFIVVVSLRHIRQENIVYQVERIHGL